MFIWSEQHSLEKRGQDFPSLLRFSSLFTCTNTLHYLQEPVVVLKELSAQLAEQGQFVLEDSVLRAPPFLWKLVERAIRVYDSQHWSLFSSAEAQRLCQQAGLHVGMAHIFPIDLFCQGWVIRAICQELRHHAACFPGHG